MRITIRRGTKQPVEHRFLEHIQKRAQEWSHVKKLAARIVVPPELQWWYWQEFGTAVRGDAGRASGKTYRIPLSGYTTLKWPNAKSPNKPDGWRWQGPVEAHPGIYPQHFITNRLRLFLTIAAQHLNTVWRKAPMSLLAARDELRDKTMPVIKSHIVDAMRVQIPGTRTDQWARLHWQTAGGVFDREAKIVDTTEGEGVRPFTRKPAGLLSPNTARSYARVSKLGRGELTKAERLAMTGAANEQEYRRNLKARRMSEYHAGKKRKRT